MACRSTLSIHSFSNARQILRLASVALLWLSAVARGPLTRVEKENGELRRRIASLEAGLAACRSKCAVVLAEDLVARQDDSRFTSFTPSPRRLPINHRRGAPSCLACHTAARNRTRACMTALTQACACPHPLISSAYADNATAGAHRLLDSSAPPEWGDNAHKPPHSPCVESHASICSHGCLAPILHQS